MFDDNYNSRYVTGPRELFEDGKKWRAANPKKPPTYDRDPDDLRAMCTPDEQWVHDQLQRFRYKPNVEWQVVPACEGGGRTPPGAAAWLRDDAVTVRFVMWVLDSRGGDRIVPITSTSTLDYYTVKQRDEAILGYELRSMIDAAESHEIDEWFRRDGALVNDPHAAPASKLVRSDIKVGEWLR